MKKVSGILVVAIVVIMTACSDKPAAVKKEVIIVPSSVLTKDGPEKSTTVTVDKNGVKVVAKKIDVSVKKQ